MKVCLHSSDSHPSGAMQGGSPLFDLASRDNSARKRFPYLPTVWLASCRIRLNCFFILYFSVSTYEGKYSALLLTIHISILHRGAAQIPISHSPPFPHRKLPAPKKYSTITYFQLIDICIFFAHLYLLHCLRRDAGPVHRAYTQAGSDSSDK